MNRPDTRRVPRVPAHWLVQWRSQGAPLEGHLCDLSPMGAFVTLPQTHSVNPVGELWIESYLTHKPLSLPARVARVEKGQRLGLGVEFQAVDQTSAGVLNRYCEQFTRDAPRVLAIDDDMPLLRVMGRFLEREGWSFVGLSGALPPSHIVERYAPDLIILDVMMPGTNGAVLAGQLEETYGAKCPPVMFYSASFRDDIPAEFRHIPFVAKGAVSNTLVPVVRNVLGAGRVTGR